MAINTKTWANGNHLSVTEMQNLQDNSVNTTDNIHTQYFSGISTTHEGSFDVETDGAGLVNEANSFYESVFSPGSFRAFNFKTSLTNADTSFQSVSMLNFIRGITTEINLRGIFKVTALVGPAVVGDVTFRTRVDRVDDSAVRTNLFSNNTASAASSSSWTVESRTAIDISSAASTDLITIEFQVDVNNQSRISARWRGSWQKMEYTRTEPN